MLKNKLRWVIVAPFFALIVLEVFAVMHFGLFDRVAGALEPKETGTQTVVVDDVSFMGEKTFWSDERMVSFDTPEGTFVYPKENVSYEVVAEGITSIEVVSYDRTKDYVHVLVAEEDMKTIQSAHADKFKENVPYRINEVEKGGMES